MTLASVGLKDNYLQWLTTRNFGGQGFRVDLSLTLVCTYLFEIAGDLEQLPVGKQLFLEDVYVTAEVVLLSVGVLKRERAMQAALVPWPDVPERDLLWTERNAQVWMKCVVYENRWNRHTYTKKGNDFQAMDTFGKET